MGVSLSMLMWNILLYYTRQPVAIVVLCLVMLFLGVRIFMLYSRQLPYPIDGTREKRVELAVSLVWFVTGTIQSFHHVFPDWWRVTTFTAMGLIAGMNISIMIKNRDEN